MGTQLTDGSSESVPCWAIEPLRLSDIHPSGPSRGARSGRPPPATTCTDKFGLCPLRSSASVHNFGAPWPLVSPENVEETGDSSGRSSGDSGSSVVSGGPTRTLGTCPVVRGSELSRLEFPTSRGTSRGTRTGERIACQQQRDAGRQCSRHVGEDDSGARGGGSCLSRQSERTVPTAFPTISTVWRMNRVTVD